MKQTWYNIFGKNPQIETKEEPSRDVALVLSSGGAKGFAHIGVIEELLSQGYNITSVAGTSMGALIGGMYAAGGLDKVKEWFYALDHGRIWSLLDFTFSINSFLKGDKVIESLKEIVPDVMIEDLPIPFCAISTDLRTGEEVVFREGSLYEAIRASISLPVIFTQVENDDMLLVDGGLVNGLPLNRVARKPGDLLVAVNLDNYEWNGDAPEPSVARRKGGEGIAQQFLEKFRSRLSTLGNNHINMLRRSLTIAMRYNIRQSLLLTPPNIYINVKLDEYGSYDYDHAREIAEVGRKTAREVLD